jgi:hypothetical protein
MKKTLLAMLVILTFATSAFAGVSYLVAPSVGEGNWAVLGMYATNHNGAIANRDDPQTMDSNSLGARGEYGMMKDLDLLVAYSFDTLVNIKDIDDGGKQTSGSTMGLGAKYTLGNQSLPLIGKVDTAVAIGYETSSVGIKSDNISSIGITTTAMSIGYIVSMQMDNLMPYGAVAYKMLTESFSKSGIDSLSGTGLAFNIGCMIGIAKDQAIAVEYNTENQSYGAVAKSFGPIPAKDDAAGINVSGISLGYVYMF